MSGVRITFDSEFSPELIEQIAQRVAEINAASSTTSSPWLTVDQAAAYLSWPKDRIYKLTSAGAIPHRKNGNRILLHRQEIDAWLDGYREGPRTSWKPPAGCSTDFQRPMDTGIASEFLLS